MPQYSFGLASAKFGAKGALDVMGTTLAALGKSREGSVSFTIPEQSKTEFRSEEDEAPVFQITDNDKPAVFELELMDADADSLATVFGGTVTGTSPKVWEPPLVSTVIEKSVEITTKNGVIIKIPRGALTPMVDFKISRKELWGVKVRVEALKPASALLAPYSISFP